MKNIPGKYTRDSAGNIISPITNIGTVYYDENKDYDTYIKEYIDSLINTLKSTIASVDKIYPVGSIYMNMNDVQPNVIFPGTTWERLQDRFLLGVGSKYVKNTTGGEEKHTLTLAEIPSHTHTYMKANSSTGSTVLNNSQIPSHSHSFNAVTNLSVSYNNRTCEADDIDINPCRPVINVSSNSGSGTTGVSGGTSGHDHTIGGTEVNTGAMGGTQAHNNMPPYQTVYMWKRIS